MKKEEVSAILTAHRDTLHHLGVKSLELFGSVARNDANSQSDVDFLVEFHQEAGFFELFNLQHYLEEILGCPVDIGMKNSLRQEVKDSVFKDLICVL